MRPVPFTRRALAVTFAVATLVPLTIPRFMPRHLGGGEGQVGRGLEAVYEYGELTVREHVLGIALALAIAFGAGLVRAARDRRLVAVGVVVAFAGLALTAVLAISVRAEPQSAAVIRAIRLGMTRDEVRAIAGRPEGDGTASTPSGEQLDCLVYFGSEPDPHSRLYCFGGDRLVAVSE